MTSNDYNDTFKDTKKLSDALMPQSKAVLSKLLKLNEHNITIEDADLATDRKLCTDLFLKSGNPNNHNKIMVAIRARVMHQNYNESYLDDITLRSELINKFGRKVPTEIDKLKTAPVRLFLYSIFTENGEHIKSTLIDVAKFLKEIDAPYHTIVNNDGSKAFVYRTVQNNGSNKPWVSRIHLN